MDYTQEFNVETFEFWSGAESTFNKIKEKDLVEEFQSHLEEVFYDRIPTATEINDYVWFDSDSIFEALGISEEDE